MMIQPASTDFSGAIKASYTGLSKERGKDVAHYATDGVRCEDLFFLLRRCQRGLESENDGEHSRPEHHRTQR